MTQAKDMSSEATEDYDTELQAAIFASLSSLKEAALQQSDCQDLVGLIHVAISKLQSLSLSQQDFGSLVNKTLEEAKASIPSASEVEAEFLAQRELYLDSIKLVVELLESCLSKIDHQASQLTSLQQQFAASKAETDAKIKDLQDQLDDQKWYARARTAVAKFRRRIAVALGTTWSDLLTDLEKEEEEQQQPAKQRILDLLGKNGLSPSVWNSCWAICDDSNSIMHIGGSSSFGQLIQDFEKAATPTAAQPYVQDLLDALHLAKKGQGIIV